MLDFYQNINSVKIEDFVENLSENILTVIYNNKTNLFEEKMVSNNDLKQMDIIEEHQFKERFNKYTEDTLDFLKTDDDWKNVIVAGGSIINILDKNFNMKNIYDSDIDLFLYGDEQDQKEKAKYIIRNLENKYNNIKYFIKNYKNQMIEIRIPNKKNIQLVFSAKWGDRHQAHDIIRKPIDVISNFDMNGCKIFYNGKNIYTASKESLFSIKYKLLGTDINHINSIISCYNCINYYKNDDYDYDYNIEIEIYEKSINFSFKRLTKYIKNKNFTFINNYKHGMAFRTIDFQSILSEKQKYLPVNDFNNHLFGNHLFDTRKYQMINDLHIEDFINDTVIIDYDGYSYDDGYQPSEDLYDYINKYVISENIMGKIDITEYDIITI
jgi:hypothetical protein